MIKFSLKLIWKMSLNQNVDKQLMSINDHIRLLRLLNYKK